MKQVFDWLLQRYEYENEDDRSAARLLANIVLFSIFGAITVAVVTAFNADYISTVALGAAAAVLAGILVLLRGGRLAWCRWLVPLVVWVLISYEVYAVGDGTREVQILGYPLVVLFATLLAGARGTWVFTGLSSLSYTAILFIHKYELLRPMDIAERLLPSDAVIATIVLVLVAYIQLTIVNRLSTSLVRQRANEAELRTTIMALEAVQDSLEDQVLERTAQIAASAEVGRLAGATLDPDQVVRRTVDLIADRFGHYYAAIFLVDDSGIWANLVAATGEAGQTLLEREHRLQIGGRSMVGAAISSRSSRIALDAGAEPVRFDNPLLPDTRSEIALPLSIGDRVLGALDVQSVEGSAFDAQDIEVLQGMANSVAVALDNARLYQESQGRLETLNRFYRRDIRTAPTALRYRDGQIAIPPPETLPALEGGPDAGMQVRHQGDVTRVIVPFVAGGQRIGVMELQSKTRRWTEEELSMLASAANQVSTALENAILVQETQERARQERVLSEGTARIRETLDIESILRTAAADIQRTLSLAEVEVRIGLDRDPDAEKGT
ncbi:MAG TPA: GAF domain-containing protein [Anaerolineales bacterium]|nr:GAF domain-containing protein [Anaerolineales bacterium]